MRQAFISRLKIQSVNTFDGLNVRAESNDDLQRIETDFQMLFALQLSCWITRIVKGDRNNPPVEVWNNGKLTYMLKKLNISQQKQRKKNTATTTRSVDKN